MARIPKIDQEIAAHTVELQEVQAVRNAAAQSLASNPRDAAAMKNFTAAKATLAEIECRIEALEIARKQALKHDQSDEGKAQSEHRRQASKQVVRAYQDTVRLAREWDTAFTALLEKTVALCRTEQANREVTTVYLRKCDLDPVSRLRHIELAQNAATGIRGANEVLSHALYEIAMASGLPYHQRIAFNFLQLDRSKPPSLAENSQRAAENMAQLIDSIEAGHG